MPSITAALLIVLAGCSSRDRNPTPAPREDDAATANETPAVVESPAPFEIVAHRGSHVMWKKGAYDPVTGCEARHIEVPGHDLIENTIGSIRRAFERGATIVEIDIRRSRDDVLMVFHDFDLSCRTEGRGKVSEHTVAELKALDVGHGYTADDGATFPLRGKGVGLMPTLAEVLDAFPQRRFLVDHKDQDAESAALLVQTLRPRTAEANRRVFYWGPADLHRQIAAEVPEVRRLFPSRREIKACLLPYVASAGLAGFSESCRGQNIGMNREYAGLIPGWPDRFLAAARDNDNPVFLMVDTREDVELFKGLPVAGIVTDYIDSIAAHYIRAP